jgi:hypothetical protein
MMMDAFWHSHAQLDNLMELWVALRNFEFFVPKATEFLDPDIASRAAVRSVLDIIKEAGLSGMIVRQASVENIQDDCKNPSWVCFLAVEVKYPNVPGLCIEAFVVHITGGTEDCPALSVSVQSECMGPSLLHCPPYVLEVLTDTENTKARSWRHQAAELAPAIFKYQTSVEISPMGDKSVSVHLGTAQETHEIARTGKLTGNSFKNVYEDFIRSYHMCTINTVRIG